MPCPSQQPSDKRPVLWPGITIAKTFANYTIFVMPFVAPTVSCPALAPFIVKKDAGLGWRSAARCATRTRCHIDTLGNFSSSRHGTVLRPPVAGCLSVPKHPAHTPAGAQQFCPSRHRGQPAMAAPRAISPIELAYVGTEMDKKSGMWNIDALLPTQASDPVSARTA